MDFVALNSKYFIQWLANFGRRGLLPLLILMLTIGVLQESRAAYVCHKAHSDGTSLQNIFPLNLVSYLEDHSRQVHIDEFWQTHQRFGFVKTDDQRILLVGKASEEIRQVVDELQEASGIFSPTPVPTKNTPVKEGLSFDVTKFIDPMMRSILDFQPKANGPNCFNLCLIRSGITAFFRPTTHQEFRHWLNGPLSEEIKSMDDLSAGDIIAFWDPQDGYLHGAIFISKNIVISKNGTTSTRGYRIQDIREVAYDFGPTELGLVPSKIKAYRLRDWRELLNKLSQTEKEDFLFFWNETEAYESLVHDFYTKKSTLSRLNIAEKIDRYVIETLDLVQYQLLSLQLIKNPSTEEKAQKFLWKALELRIQSLRQFKLQSSKLN